MANVVEIQVKADGNKAKLVFKDVTDSAQKAVSRVADSSRGIIGKAASAARSIFSNVVTGLSNMGDAIVSKVGTALKVGLAGVGIAAGAALFGGVRRLLNIENAIHGLEQMGLTGKQTRKLMDDLVKTMMGMTFTLDSGAQAIKRLVTAGTPLDQVNKRFLLMADAAAFGQAPLQELTNIFERITTEGKLTGETLNMLHVRGVPALKLLASAAGVTETEFRELLSSGEINADKFFKLWEKGAKGFGETNIKMAGAAKSMEQTTSGAFMNMRTAFVRVAATLAGPVFSQMRGIFIGITKRIEEAEPAIQRFSDRFSEVAEDVIQTKVIPAFRTVAEVFRERIIPAVQAMAQWISENREIIAKFVKAILPAIGIVTALSVAISLVKNAFILLIRFTPIGIITALIAALIFAWQNSETFREVVTSAFNAVKGAAEILWGFFKENMLPVLTQLWEFTTNNLVPALGLLLSGAVDPLRKGWEFLSNVITEFVIPAFQTAHSWFVDNILPVLLDVAKFITDKVIPAFVSFRDSVIEHIVTPLQTAWAEFKEKYLPTIKEAAKETKEKLQKAWEDLKAIWEEDLKPALEQLWKTFQKDVLPALKLVWQEIDGPLLEVLKTLGILLAGAAFLAILGFLKLLGRWAQGISNVIGFVRTLIDVWNRLRRAASRIVKRVTIPGGEAIRRLIGRILSLWNALRRIGGVVLNISAPGLGSLLSRAISLSNLLPGFQHGGIGSGLAVVGERGREIVNLGASGRVIPHEESERILSGQNGRQIVGLEFSAKPGFDNRFMDLVVQNLLLRIRTSTEIQGAIAANPGGLVTE